MDAIAATFRAPCLSPDARSQVETESVRSVKPLGEGASPSDALEFWLKKIENVQVFPEIPHTSPAHTFSWASPEEVPAAPSEDCMSFFGLKIEAATPKNTSLERRKFRPLIIDGLPESRGMGPEPRMCYDTEGNAVPYTSPKTSHTKSLRASLNALEKSKSLPILCSDRTVRVENSSKGVGTVKKVSTSLPNIDETQVPLDLNMHSIHPSTPPKSYHTKKIGSSLRSLGKKSASLPSLFGDKTNQLDDTVKPIEDRFYPLFSGKKENKRPGRNSTTKEKGRKTMSRSKSPPKRRLFAKSDSNPDIMTKPIMSTSDNGRMLIEI